MYTTNRFFIPLPGHINTMSEDLPRQIRAREHTASMIAHFIVEARPDGGSRPITSAVRAVSNPGDPVPPLEHPNSLMQEVYENIYANYTDQDLIDEYWLWTTARAGAKRGVKISIGTA